MVGRRKLPAVLMMRDFGTEQQKKEILPGMLNGTMRIAFGLTEPKHGSDATWMETRAVKDGNGWRINGEKMWNTGVHVATHDMVFCRTSGKDGEARGLTCLIVPMSDPGVKIEKICGRSTCQRIAPTSRSRMCGCRTVRCSVRWTTARPRTSLRAREPHPSGGVRRLRGAVLHQ